jgi:hypothetical protein
MSRKYRTGLMLALTGSCILVVSAFLTLAIDQARNLISLYTVSVSPPRATGVRNLWRLNASLSSDVLILAIVAAVLFILVFRHPRRLAPVSIVAALALIALNLFSGRHVLPQLLVWPTPISISEQYVRALAANDLDAALRLTNGSEECRTIMAQEFQDDQARLKQRIGGNLKESNIRDIFIPSITTFYDKPLPRGFVIMQPVPKQLATIMVKTENGGTIWLNLKMSYSPFLGTRYICGGHIDSR